jgi:hypothetical protein
MGRVQNDNKTVISYGVWSSTRSCKTRWSHTGNDAVYLLAVQVNNVSSRGRDVSQATGRVLLCLISRRIIPTDFEGPRAVGIIGSVVTSLVGFARSRGPGEFVRAQCSLLDNHVGPDLFLVGRRLIARVPKHVIRFFFFFFGGDVEE